MRLPAGCDSVAGLALHVGLSYAPPKCGTFVGAMSDGWRPKKPSMEKIVIRRSKTEAGAGRVVPLTRGAGGALAA